MAVEPRRGCGYRRVGGVYLVGGGLSAPCDRMPFPLERCRTCGGGVKFTRGHTWLQPDFFDEHLSDEAHVSPSGRVQWCQDDSPCPVCRMPHGYEFAPHLLLWIGRGHYSPESYLDESRRLGVSRRLSAVPKGLVLGQTWVLLAHLDAVPPASAECSACGFPEATHIPDTDVTVTVADIATLATQPHTQSGTVARVTSDGTRWTLIGALTTPPDGVTVVDAAAAGMQWQRAYCPTYRAPKPTPGIFCAFVPRAVELVLRESDATPDRVERERKRGVTVVAVPDDDPDHNPQGGEGDDDSQPELPGVQPGAPA